MVGLRGMPATKRQKRRRKLWIAAGLLILVLVIIGAYQFFTSGAFLQPRVEAALTEALDTECQVEGIKAGLFGGASIERLSIFVPGDKSDPAPSRVVVEDCFAHHDWTRLLTGEYRLEQVRVGRLASTITPPFVDWLQKLRARPGRGKPQPIPQIEIETGMVSVDMPALRRQVNIENVNLLMGQEKPGRLSGVASFRVGGNLVRLRINAVPRQSQGELELAVQGFDLSALPLIPTKIGWFNPEKLFLEGSLTGNVSAYLSAGPGSAPAFSGEFALAETEAGYRGWPIELAEGFGSFRVSQRGISLRDITANVGRGRIAITNGRVGLNEGKLDHVALRGTGRGLDLSLLTHKTLPWSQHMRGRGAELESGLADVDFNLQWSPGSTPSYEARVSLQDGAFTLTDYDVRLSDARLDATVASPGRISIETARARAADGLAEVTGSFEVKDGKLEQPHLQVDLTDISVKPELVQKADPDTGALLKSAGLVNPETDGHVSINPSGIDAELNLTADAVQPEVFDYSLSDLTGTFTWSSADRRFTFRKVRASKQGGQIDASGSVRLDERPELSVSLFGRSLPMNEELLGLLPPETRERFADWHPTGAFDLEVRCRDWKVPDKLSQDVLQDFEVEVDLRNFGVRHAGTGQVMSNLYGHASLQEDAFNLTGITGEVLGKGFRAGGLVPLPGSKTQASLQVESDNLSISPEWLRNCPWDGARTLADMKLEGACGFQAQLSQLPTDGKPLTGSLTAIFHYLRMQPYEVQMRASGTTRMDLQALGEDGTRASGELELQDAGMSNLDADRLTGQFEFKDDILKVPVVRVGAYGGKVTIENTEFQASTGDWNTDIKFSHMDFESLMGAFGIEGKETPSGVLRGTVKLRGESANPETLKGNAQIKIDRGTLYGFPILISVLNVLDLGLPSQSPVTNAYGTFSIGGGEITIEDLIFGGGGMPVLVTGTVGLEKDIPFAKQPINLLVTVSKGQGLLDSIPIVNWIKHYTIDMLRSLIFQARVTGTFEDYEISTVADPVTAPIKGLWSLLDRVTPSPPGKQEN